jgi:hypothetical protein
VVRFPRSPVGCLPRAFRWIAGTGERPLRRARANHWPFSARLARCHLNPLSKQSLTLRRARYVVLARGRPLTIRAASRPPYRVIKLIFTAETKSTFRVPAACALGVAVALNIALRRRLSRWRNLENSHLTVLDPPSRSTVLGSHPDRPSAFLQESCLIDDSNA